MKKNVNRFISIFMTFLVCVSLYMSIPIAAITTLNVFEYDNYNIKYSIVNEWDNNRNIEITFTNKGNETIYNWALGFDAGGEILGLWNGTIYDRKALNHDQENEKTDYSGFVLFVAAFGVR